MHIAVLHVVEVPVHAHRIIAEGAARWALTLRLYFRLVESAWQDLIIVAEGHAAQLDAFISSLKALDALASDVATQDPDSVRGVSMLLRQWTYMLPALPASREQWGYAEWIAEADRELLEFEQQKEDEGLRPPAASETEPRHLGPPGVRGSAYRDWQELASKRLEKLDLGCNWDDVLTAAQLAASRCRREDSAADDGRGSEPSGKRIHREGAGSNSIAVVGGRLGSLHMDREVDAAR